MARQYSHLQFFRRTPNALLARYFREKHGVLQQIAFEKRKIIRSLATPQQVMQSDANEIAEAVKKKLRASGVDIQVR